MREEFLLLLLLLLLTPSLSRTAGLQLHTHTSNFDTHLNCHTILLLSFATFVGGLDATSRNGFEQSFDFWCAPRESVRPKVVSRIFNQLHKSDQ